MDTGEPTPVNSRSTKSVVILSDIQKKMASTSSFFSDIFNNFVTFQLLFKQVNITMWGANAMTFAREVIAAQDAVAAFGGLIVESWQPNGEIFLACYDDSIISVRIIFYIVYNGNLY